jgi:hypothetical protein
MRSASAGAARAEVPGEPDVIEDRSAAALGKLELS